MHLILFILFQVIILVLLLRTKFLKRIILSFLLKTYYLRIEKVKPKNERSTNLIWLQHVRKAGGSSIVSLAEKNGLNFHQPHFNANPKIIYNGMLDKLFGVTLAKLTGIEHRYIPFHKFNKEQFYGWIHNLKGQGVNFIGCEFGFPGINNLPDNSNIKYLITFRDPYARYISQYFFSYGHKELPITIYYPVKKYLGLEYTSNYYTKLLSGKSPISKISEDVFQTAVEALKKFDVIVILEKPETFDNLRKLGWNDIYAEKNKGKYDELKNRIPEKFEQLFKNDNQFDYRLYEEACKIATR